MSTTTDVVLSGGKDELDKWNWGAFLWTWIWAFGHRRWGQGLLWLVVSFFIPLVANVYLGVKGNRFAWETGNYSSREELRASQRRWVWAWMIFIGVIAAIVLVLVVVAPSE